MSADEAEYVSAGFIAKLVDLDRRTVYRWIDLGLLPSVKLGPGRASAVRIKKSDLDEFLENARRGDAAPVEPEPVAPRRRPRRTRKAVAA